MRFKLFIVSLLSLCLAGTVNAQFTAKDYFPLKEGSTWNYQLGWEYYSDTIIAPLCINGVCFERKARTYSWGDADTTLYKFVQGALYYVDGSSLMLNKLIPAQPTLGESWISTDKNWQYTITHTDSSFQSAAGLHKHSLAIKAKNMTPNDDGSHNSYTMFFAPYIGFVGSWNNGSFSQLNTYRLTDK